MRICSLLPGATEIVFSLGMGSSLVGVSHECDFPAEARSIPRVTRSMIDPDLSSREIDETVDSSLRDGKPLYELDEELLKNLQPDLILTQGLCDVCAVSTDLVHEVLGSLPHQPQVLDLRPHSLGDILDNIRTVASTLGCKERAREVIGKLQSRVQQVRMRAQLATSCPRVFTMEWVDPPYCGGHWMGELVAIAGGRDDLANLYLPSYRIEWETILNFAPEVFVLTCCGYDLPRSMQEAEALAAIPGIWDVPAVQQQRVYVTAGSGYFSRPGPRIVDSLEILAHIIHPELFPPPALEGAFASVRIAPAQVGA